MKPKAQEWFLIKKNWMDELKDLSREDFGTLIYCLFTSQAPEGHLKLIYGLLKDEFDRVNEHREGYLAKRREASLKGVEARKNKTSGGTSGKPKVDRTHTHTHTHTPTSTPKEDRVNDLEVQLTGSGLYHPTMKIPGGLTKEEYLNFLNQ